MTEARCVTVFGGSGFVGQYIVRRMVAEGWQVRSFSRTPGRADDGAGQITGNIRDEDAVCNAVEGVTAVVNLVAVLNSVGTQSFEELHVAAAERVAKAAAAAGVARFVHMSSIGSCPDAASEYSRTKGRGQEAVLQHFPAAMILRPSLIFGAEDDLFNRFAAMARFSPALPILGGNTRFQPVYVDDVAAAACMGITGAARPGVYELGGPDIETLTQLMHRMLQGIGWRRRVINLPFPVGLLLAGGLDFLQILTGGAFENRLVTRDQIATMKSDNVATPGTKGLADLGITPTPMADILPGYLNAYSS
ncbi:MAG: complex I NDUFA9 subunit family protein [Rhodobacteraceae bacterium]|nr:complex I NDUFA9 subunit family protein [Paracoccaceae bacterium]